MAHKNTKWISAKIKKIRKEGRPQKQAIAIAFSMGRRKHKKRK